MQSSYQFSTLTPPRADDDMADLLQQAGRRRSFATGALVQKQGDVGGGLWMVEAGKLCVCRFGVDGNQTVFGLFGPGDVFGELAHFANIARQVDVVAETDAVLTHLAPATIDGLIATEPRVARWLLTSLAGQLRTALDLIEGDRNLSAEVRVARKLSDMQAVDGAVLTLTQDSLANIIGVSRVTIGQILRDFARDGIVQLAYRRIIMLNIDALAQRAYNR